MAISALLACGPATSGTGGSSESTGSESTDPTMASIGSLTGPTSPTTTDTTTTASTTDGTSTTDPSDPTVPTGDTGSSDDGSTTTTTTTTTGESSSSDGGESSSSEDTGQVVDLEPWTQRRQVFIDNTNEVDLTEHEIAIDLDIDPEMNGNLSDLRFTAEADSAELLPHWLETQSPGVSFRAWVRVPFVPAEDVGVIYMWYGNEDAADVSDPVATFHFWEPFDGDELADIWASNGEYEVANGLLTITNGSVYTVDPLVTLPGFVVDARMRWPGNDSNETFSGLNLGDLPGIQAGITYLRFLRVPALQIDGAIDAVVVGGGNPVVPFQATTMEWLRVGSGAEIARGGWTHTPPPPSTNLDFGAEYAEEMYVWLGEGGGTGVVNPSDIYDVEIDTLLIRRFEDVDPEISRGPEEDV